MLGYEQGLTYGSPNGYASGDNPVHLALAWWEYTMAPSTYSDPAASGSTHKDPWRSTTVSPFGSVIRWTSDGKAHWRLRGDDTTYRWYSSYAGYQVLGAWRHYCAVLDCVAQVVRWYANGQFVGGNACTELTYYAHTGASSTIPTPCHHTDGQFVTDARRYCDYPLTDADVQLIYDARGRDRLALDYCTRYTMVLPLNAQLGGSYTQQPVRCGAHVAGHLDAYERLTVYSTTTYTCGPAGDISPRCRRRRV